MRKIDSKVGQLFAESLVITNELGGNKVECQCQFCGAVRIYTKSALIRGDTTRCQDCKDVKEFRLKLGDKTTDFEIIELYGIKSALRCKCNKCGTIQTMTRSSFVNKTTKCLKCAGIAVDKNKVGETFGTLKIIKELGGNEVQCRCIKCGATKIYKKNLAVNGQKKCDFCGSTSALEKLRGLRILNKVFNGLLVTSIGVREDGIPIGNVTCLNCGWESTLGYGGLITKSRYCKICKEEPIVPAKCPNCLTPVKIKYTSIARGCQKCGNKIDLRPFRTENDRKLEIRNNISLYKAELKNPTIQCDVQPLSIKYHGRNGMIYYDAICLIHNKRLIISRKEIENFDHELCKTSYNMELTLRDE